MKKIGRWAIVLSCFLAWLIACLFICCQKEEAIKPIIKTKQITLSYDIGFITYYFDLDNTICYIKHAHNKLLPVDFKTCYYLYIEYIEPNEKPNKESREPFTN